uniref:Uncharacterized protein n=1 Tax=Romanomermis culicivorax TaxID=13658 RepID=A0A915JUF6_ROMCU
MQLRDSTDCLGRRAKGPCTRLLTASSGKPVEESCKIINEKQKRQGANGNNNDQGNAKRSHILPALAKRLPPASFDENLVANQRQD